MSNEKKLTKFLKDSRTQFITVLALGLLTFSQGYSAEDDLGKVKDLDNMANQIKDFLFGPIIRKIGLTLGMGAGLVQAFVSGSIRPLLIYGGLGLVVGFLPALIEKISSITG